MPNYYYEDSNKTVAKDIETVKAARVEDAERRKKIAEKQRKDFARMVEDGFTAEDIHVMTGIPLRTIYLRLKEAKNG